MARSEKKKKKKFPDFYIWFFVKLSVQSPSLSHTIPSFQWPSQSNEILLNLSMKC